MYMFYESEQQLPIESVHYMGECIYSADLLLNHLVGMGLESSTGGM